MAAAGRPDAWTCDDAEAARLQANQTARAGGARGPTPEGAWQHRRPLGAQERAEYAAAVRGREQEVRAEQGYPPAGSLERTAQAAVARAALRRALADRGLLTITPA